MNAVNYEGLCCPFGNPADVIFIFFKQPESPTSKEQ